MTYELTLYELIKDLAFMSLLILLAMTIMINNYKHEKDISKLDGYMDYNTKIKELNTSLELRRLELKYELKRIKAEKK